MLTLWRSPTPIGVDNRHNDVTTAKTLHLSQFYSYGYQIHQTCLEGLLDCTDVVWSSYLKAYVRCNSIKSDRRSFPFCTSSSMCRKHYFYFGLFYSMAIKLGMPVTDALLQLFMKFKTLILKYSKVVKLYMLTAAFSLKRTDRRVIIGSLILLLQFATHPVHKTW